MGSIKLSVTIPLCDMIIFALFITAVAGLDRDFSTMRNLTMTPRNLTMTPREMRQVPALPCGSRADLNEDEEVTLESPNYPNLYPNRAKCSWSLMVPAGKEVQVYCESFHIEKGDFLRIGSDHWYGKVDGGGSIRVPTGGELGDPQQKLKVVFKSNRRRQANGFRCTFDVESENGGSTEQQKLLDPLPQLQRTGMCQCGIKGGTQSDRIVGGQEAEQHEYPWQVGLVSKNGKTPWCGGTLISDRHILTAAHCTEKKTPESIQILLGEHRTNDDVFTRVDISKINDDPNYSMPNGDFSILTLTNPVTFTSSIRPACLPATTDKTYEYELATVTGWGTLSSGGNQPTVLMEVDVTVTTNEICNNVYGSINSLHICAMDPGKDSCQGDSGGPLVVKENDRWTLIGVVSFGYGCAQPDIPGVYARVTQRMDWIKENTAGTYTSTCQAA